MGTEAVGWVIRQNIKDPLAKLVLIGLADCFHDKTGECFPSKATLLEVAPCSEDCLKKKMRYLEKEGWIKRVRRFEANGRQTTNAYEILFERGVTREEYARQQAEKREAKQSKGRGDQKSPPRGDHKSPGGVTTKPLRGVTENPPLTTTNEQRSAQARTSISLPREGAGCNRPAPPEPPCPEMRRKIGDEMKALVAKMKVSSPRRMINA